MTQRKTYRVRFSVTDFYVGEVRAVSPRAAIGKAQRLYAEQYEQAFEFDISAGGHNGDWRADDVSP
jgi:hypothetical protein